MDKGRLTILVQKQLAVDMVVQCQNGVTVGIEEKSAAGRAMNICTFALEENSSNVISSVFGMRAASRPRIAPERPAAPPLPLMT